MFNLEQPKNTEPNVVFLHPSEISGQLDVSQERYEQALGELRAGNIDVDDIAYLQGMQQNLINFKYNLDVNIGTLTPANAEISRRVTERLYELSEEIDRVVH